jgi:YVTN family beta-propeller protein
VSGMDEPLRDLLEAAVGDPPHRVNVEAVRRRVVRRRVIEGIAGAAAVAVLVIAVPVVTGTLGHSPAAQRPQTHPSHGPVAYVINLNNGSGMVTLIATATNTPGKPITVRGDPVAIAITPDRKIVYVASADTAIPANESATPGIVTPIATATGTPAGKPIMVGGTPLAMAITPDGETLYVVNESSGTVTPITTATGTPGTSIRVGDGPVAIATTPDDRTAYVLNNGSGTVTPITTATGTPGTPIRVGGDPVAIAITPDSKTAYVLSNGSGTVTPIATATNTPGTPITVATNTPGKPITVGPHPWAIAITPDSKIAYVVSSINNSDTPGTVTPISTATNMPGKPITVVARAMMIAIG